MKKLMTLMLGMSLAIGATVAFAADQTDTKTSKTTKSKTVKSKTKKPKKDTTTTTAK